MSGWQPWRLDAEGIASAGARVTPALAWGLLILGGLFEVGFHHLPALSRRRLPQPWSGRRGSSLR